MSNPFDIIDARLSNIENILLDFRQHISAPPSIQSDNLITRQEAADTLRVTLPTLHSYTLEGKVKGYRIGRRVLYKKEEIAQAVTAISTSKRRA